MEEMKRSSRLRARLGVNRGNWSYKHFWLGLGVEDFNVGLSVDSKGVALFFAWWHVLLWFEQLQRSGNPAGLSPGRGSDQTNVKM